MRFFIPTLLILISGGIFFWYVDPAYQSAKELATRKGEFDQALTKSKELLTVRDALLSRYNTISNSNLGRLEKLLPNSVDNVKLVLDIDNIAARYNLRIRNVIIDDRSAAEEEGASRIVRQSATPLGSVVLTFSVASTYPSLIAFLADLEQSLRLVDVTGLSFAVREGDLNEYIVSITTYWLR